MSDDPSRIAEAATRRAQRVPLRGIWIWIAPWLAGALLGGAALLGVFTASGAHDGDTYAVGLFTAGLALVALVWLVKRSVDGPARGWSFDLLVEQPESLLVLIALLAAIGIGGLFLAADTRGAAELAGYALFVVCLVLVAWNLKHYYDRTDCR
ncbi:MAG: hypothetical protein KGQ82_08160 [Alphaproteobacteria bacterium]|nr:hypothetical protein [Alphaproteobacteria bacterium]